jgi:hypothetical protein
MLTVIARVHKINDQYNVQEIIQHTTSSTISKAIEVNNNYSLTYYCSFIFYAVKIIDTNLGITSTIAAITRFFFRTTVKVDETLRLLDVAAYILSTGAGILADRMISTKSPQTNQVNVENEVSYPNLIKLSDSIKNVSYQ